MGGMASQGGIATPLGARRPPPPRVRANNAQWELFDGGVPWAGHKPLQISFKVVFEHARPPVPPAMPEHLATVMRRAWANDAATRPTFADIVRHVRADQAQESSTAGAASDARAAAYRLRPLRLNVLAPSDSPVLTRVALSWQSFGGFIPGTAT